MNKDPVIGSLFGIAFLPDTAYMPVPRCDQCKHWDTSHVPPHHDATGTGYCNRMLEPNSKAYADMDDGVLTAPDFGCVQWEQEPR